MQGWYNEIKTNLVPSGGARQMSSFLPPNKRGAPQTSSSSQTSSSLFSKYKY